MLLRDNKGILTIIILFLFANLIFVSYYKDVWWDSSVYIGMGKYLFSFGNSGLWENSRPLIFPLILGIGWKLGYDDVYFGRFISIVFAILVLLITYKLGAKLFTKKVGLLAAFFTMFSYTFLFFAPNILTEIPSLFFVLLAFYFFFDKRFFLMGLFSGIAVMTRLFQVFALIGLYFVFFIYYFNKRGFSKKLFYVFFGASILIVPYFMLNYFLYNNVLLPFETQSHLTKTTGWMIYKEFGFYFSGLVRENFALLFLLAIPFVFKRNFRYYAIALTPAIYIIIFSFVKHKEMRFMLIILPFLYLLLSHCLIEIYRKIRYKRTALAFFIIVVSLWIITTFNAFSNIAYYKLQRNDDGLIHFQNYLSTSKNNIWITNPLYALYSSNRINGLLYFYSSNNLIDFLEKNKNNVNSMLFNSCDMPCPPRDLDPLCSRSRKILDEYMSNLKVVYQKEIDSCQYKILERITS